MAFKFFKGCAEKHPISPQEPENLFLNFEKN